MHNLNNVFSCAARARGKMSLSLKLFCNPQLWLSFNPPVPNQSDSCLKVLLPRFAAREKMPQPGPGTLSRATAP